MARDKFTKKEKSWILYDWANSIYATNIMAAIFPIIFVSIAGAGGDKWWGYGTSIATLVVALLAPFLGALGDFKGMKKKLFTTFMLLGVVFTALIAATNDWRIMLIGYIISRIGFSGSNLFYDSFLTDVTTNERMDRVSSWGYAMGYIGGSTIPFVLSIIVLMKLGYDSVFAQKFAVLITSVWWLLFTIPFMKNVHQAHYIEGEKPSFLAILRNLRQTLIDIAREKGMLMFITAYFFYIDGVGTIISVSTAYGSALGLGAVGMILALLVTQIVAMPCSILFAKIAKKVSTRVALMAAIAVYMFICVVGFVMGFSLEPRQDAYETAYARYMEPLQYDLSAFESPDSAEKSIAEFLRKGRDLMRDNKLNRLADTAIVWDGMTQNDVQAALALRETLFAEQKAFAEKEGTVITDYRKALSFSSVLFWCMAALVGTVQGGIQATSRSYFGKLIPKDRSNEHFGFFDILGKFASVMGPALYAFVGTLTGRSSLGTLCLAALFLIGFVILLRAKKPLEALEKSRQ